MLLSSRITHMSFDKTGTLTQNGIQIYGYIKKKDMEHVIIADQMSESIKNNDEMFKLFATCHGVYKIEERLVGDVLDLSMF